MRHRQCAVTLEPELSAAELDSLLQIIAKERLPGRYLEIGTAAGGSLCAMLQCLLQCLKRDENSSDVKPRFVVVDSMTYFPNQFEVVKENLARHNLPLENVEFRISKSYNAFLQAEQAHERFDFIFIDGAHKIRYVTQDLCWMRLLNVGGLVCLHDYEPRFKGVQLPVDRFLRKHRNYEKLAQTDSLLILRKKANSRTPEITCCDHLYAAFMTPLLQLEASLRKRLLKDRNKHKDKSKHEDGAKS